MWLSAVLRAVNQNERWFMATAGKSRSPLLLVRGQLSMVNFTGTQLTDWLGLAHAGDHCLIYGL